ncbi:MFS transporter [Aeromicrobium sp. IC_218]|uniref:MFS transporter n=1 Tax=Aeromicrobium sp. IC_218 TaxID=2545468 RepID=UPI00103DF334|nr:MFS transporter [Aeromicrobium sp. IC_218]TCI99618.1 MFS transporter [Aeromicrobium sp. IC_218]
MTLPDELLRTAGPDEDLTLRRAVGPSYFPVAFVARFPYAMMIVGVLTLVVAARDSVALGGLNSAAVGAGTAIFGPLLGMAADRFGQRPVLLVAGAANSLALLVMAAVAFSSLPDLAVLATAFVIGATAPQVAPMSRSRLFGVITEQLPARRRVKTLNGVMAYESAADETVFVFGPAIVGLLATTMNPVAPVIGAAVLTVLFVTAFALHPTGRVEPSGADERVEAAPARDLLRPGVLVAVLGTLGVGMFFGGMLTSLTAVMRDEGTGDAAGLVYGVMGIGSTILALAVAVFPERFALRARWLVFGATMLVAALGYALAGGMVGLVGAMVVAGVGIGPTLVTQYSLAATRSPVGRSATVMTMLGSAVIVGQSAASAVTGAIAESSGSDAARWVPVVAAAVVVLAAVLNVRVRDERPAAHRD